MIGFPSGVVTDPKELVHIAVTDPRGYNITLGDLRVRSATRVGDAWPWSDWERVSNARTDVWFEGKRGFRYQFMYRAQNELGSWGDFWTPRDDQWYYINNPPVANGGPAKISRAGKDVQFSADQSSDRDGDQLSWAWDFGDGGTATGLFVAHKYSKAGLYTVTLTVSDGHENSTARTTVYVEAQQKTPGFGSAVATLGIIAAAGVSVAVAGGRRSRER
jgi:PKD repeat protein